MWNEQFSAILALYKNVRFTLLFVVLLAFALAGGLLVSLIAWHAYSPLPYKDADRLVWLHGAIADKQGQLVMNGALSNIAAQYIADNSSQLDLVTPIYFGESLLEGHRAQPQVNMTYTYANYFELFGLNLRAGRPFDSRRNAHSASREAVVSECFAKRYLMSGDKVQGAVTDIISRTIHLDRQSYRVVGVVECSDRIPQLKNANHHTDVFVDFTAVVDRENPLREHLSVRYETFVVGRLKSEREIKPMASQVVAHLNQKFRESLVSIEQSKELQLNFEYRPLTKLIKGEVQNIGNWVFLGGAAFLLITLVNLFTYYFLDFKKQQAELALKVTLGAKVGTLRSAHLVQLGTLFFIAAIGAMLLSELGVVVIRNLAADTYAHMNWLRVSWWHHIVMVVAALLISVFFAYCGFAQLPLQHLHSQLHGGNKGQAKQLPIWLSNSVLVTQLSVGLVVLCLSFWLFVYFANRLFIPTGVEPNGVLFIERQQVSWGQDSSEVDARKQLFLANQRALKSHPKVEAVALSALAPFDLSYVARIGKTPQSAEHIAMHSQLVGVGYFDLLSLQIVAGRDFNVRDIDAREGVIINREAARLLALDASDIGKWIYHGHQAPTRLLGIVDNIFTHDTGFYAIVYFPHNFYETNMLVKLKTGQSMSKEEAIQVLKRQEVTQNIRQLETLALQVEELNRSAKLSLYGGIGLCFLIIAQVLVGLYGLLGNLAYSERPVLRIKQQVGAKRIQLIREQMLLRLGHFFLATLLATSVILITSSVIPAMGLTLLICYFLALLMTFSLLFFIDIHHVYQQLKKD
ncbi:ABC transporter permease [Pseudoalteromonas luteoviolacea]|uniref:ABC transporter permease n=1 Tax=Pseudoalteromonas luteoviolacea TaxID=43657 RepID=UPI001B362C2E|nr:ABC transporter permease [Pseudoalteromonas luteoviolacea]MBQ4813904.1 ABC transporter permease [Pseudoalteromonas luteoviolacea]